MEFNNANKTSTNKAELMKSKIRSKVMEKKANKVN